MSSESRKGKHRRGCIAAFLVGTALSTLPGAVAAENPARAVEDISRYCTTCWRNARLQPDCWPDCTQQVFTRLLERIPSKSLPQVFVAEGQERQEFLRAIDAVKKQTQRSRRFLPLANEVADYRDGSLQDLAEQRNIVLEHAGRCLSTRQTKIVSLSLDGYTVQDIARHTNLSPARVSDEKYKAIRRLRQLV